MCRFKRKKKKWKKKRILICINDINYFIKEWNLQFFFKYWNICNILIIEKESIWRPSFYHVKGLLSSLSVWIGGLFIKLKTNVNLLSQILIVLRMLRYKQLINLTVAVNYLFIFYFSFFGSSLHILCTLYHIMQCCHLCFLKSLMVSGQCSATHPLRYDLGKSFNKENPIQMYISHESNVQLYPLHFWLILGKEKMHAGPIWYNLSKMHNLKCNCFLCYFADLNSISCPEEGTVFLFFVFVLQDYLHVF